MSSTNVTPIKPIHIEDSSEEEDVPSDVGTGSQSSSSDSFDSILSEARRVGLFNFGTESQRDMLRRIYDGFGQLKQDNKKLNETNNTLAIRCDLYGKVIEYNTSIPDFDGVRLYATRDLVEDWHTEYFKPWIPHKLTDDEWERIRRVIPQPLECSKFKDFVWRILDNDEGLFADDHYKYRQLKPMIAEYLEDINCQEIPKDVKAEFLDYVASMPSGHFGGSYDHFRYDGLPSLFRDYVMGAGVGVYVKVVNAYSDDRPPEQNFHLCSIPRFQKLCSFKKMALKVYAKKERIYIDPSEFSISLKSGRAFRDDEEATLLMESLYTEFPKTSFVIKPRGRGGAKRTREDREQSIANAMNDIAPSNPFAATLQNFYNEAANNSQNNILANLIGNLDRDQCQALREKWYDTSQNDPQKIINHIWQQLHPEFQRIAELERHVASAKRLITQLLEAVYVKELARGESISHQRMTEMINNRYEVFAEEIRAQELEAEISRRVAERLQNQLAMPRVEDDDDDL
ncbi:unnamed protein product [Symbiodinium sp. CCMP2592]|nr:unnamed protein product [Symbiodinium sp. CCMP2592]